MLETLITNKTRIKLILRLFLNPESTGYLRGLEEEFGESSNAIRIELNRFEAAGMLESYQYKNKKMYKANKKHPIFSALNEIAQKQLGIDQVLELIIKKTGTIEKAFLTGELSRGYSQSPLELALVGAKINTEGLNQIIEKVETRIGRNILYNIYKPQDISSNHIVENNWLPLWDKKIQK
jgi:hypothetical protein